ncbi:MAG: 16S rRNA (guanine(527)-N(7))-methyltransferase RsmG [Alistipes sp.]
MELIDKYFPALTPLQRERFDALYDLYADWNAKINVVSRKDFDQLYLRHVLHSLAIAKVCSFDAGARILDVGCGGGFPSIPLAILFPEAHFTAADSIAKKISVVTGVANSLELENLTPRCARVETLRNERFDYVVSRAVTDMSVFVSWIWAIIERGEHGTLPNGILCLKGGELGEELAMTRKRWDIYEISKYFDEEFFETKKVVYTPKK